MRQQLNSLQANWLFQKMYARISLLPSSWFLNTTSNFKRRGKMSLALSVINELTFSMNWEHEGFSLSTILSNSPSSPIYVCLVQRQFYSNIWTRTWTRQINNFSSTFHYLIYRVQVSINLLTISWTTVPTNIPSGEPQ